MTAVLALSRRRPDLVLPVAIATMMVAGFVLRMIELGERPFHHDESIDAWYSWQVREGTYEGYDPIYHGPLRFYVTAAIFSVFGESHETARLLAVLSGTLLIGLPWFLRSTLGTGVTLVAPAVLAFSPAFLYFTRLGREDAPIALLTMAMIVTILRYLDRPHPALPAVFAFLLAASFAIKETTFITLFVFGSFFLALLVEQVAEQRGISSPRAWMLPIGLVPMAIAFVAGARVEVFLTLGLYGIALGGAILVLAGPDLLDTALFRAVRAVPLWAWVAMAGVFLFFFALWFTVFFDRPDDFVAGFRDGITYWRGEQATNRGSEPWYYYLYTIPLYEYLVVGLALIGTVHVFRNPTVTGKFLVWTMVATWLSFSWASERFPWLVLHLLLPMAVLAGYEARVLWRLRDHPVMRPGGVVLVGLLATTALTVVTVNYQRQDAIPRELFTQVHTTYDYLDTVERIEMLNDYRLATYGEPVTVALDTSVSVPNLWYFRDYEALSWVGDDSGPAATADFVLYEAGSAGFGSNLAGYDITRMPLRDWWAPQFDSYNAGWDNYGWANWLIDREVWNPNTLGSYDIEVAVSPRALELEAELSRLRAGG